MLPSVYRFSLKPWDHVLLIRIVVTEPNYRGIISLTVYNRKIRPDFRFIMLNEWKNKWENRMNRKKVRYSLKQKARLSWTCRCNIIYTLMISIKLWSFFFSKKMKKNPGKIKCLQAVSHDLLIMPTRTKKSTRLAIFLLLHISFIIQLISNLMI